MPQTWIPSGLLREEQPGAKRDLTSLSRPVLADEEETGVLGSIFDILGTPGRMVAGAARGLQTGEGVGRALDNLPGGPQEDDFDDVLREEGFGDSFERRAAGFVGDVVLDPLNLIPAAPLLKGIKSVGSKAGELAKLVPGVEPIVEAVGKRFVPYRGLEKFSTEVSTPAGARDLSYQDLRRLHQSGLDHVREQAGQDTLQLLEGLTADESYEVAKALDTGTPLADPRLEQIRAASKDRFDAQFAKESAAGMLPAGSRRENYVTHLLTQDPVMREVRMRALTGKNPFQIRKELSLEQGVDAGVFEPDLRRIMSKRLAVGDRALLNKEFFETTVRQFGRKADDAGQLPAGYREPILAADEPLRASLEGIALPNEIANDLEKLVTIPEQPDALARLAQGTTALWKGYATRANPGFHVRNAVSNMLQTWMGGLGDIQGGIVDPMRILTLHGKAAQILQNPQALPARIGAYTGDQVRTALDRFGVIGGAHTSFNEIDDIIEGELKHAGKGFIRRNLSPFDRRNALLRAGAKAGNAVENTSRLALFLDQVEKGKSLEEAALHVRKYLFDYSELTDFERSIRNNLFPFYTWLRKNIPLQVENALTQPAKVAALGKGFDTIEDTVEDRGMQVPDAELPEWMRGTYQQLPIETDKGAAVFADPSLPVKDLEKLAPNVQKDVLAALNPLLRIPLELGVNRQFFSQSPIYDPRLGPMGTMRRANPLASAMGITETTTKGEEMPALVDYMMRQFPFTTTMGRASSLVAPDSPDDPGDIGGLDPDTISLMGLPTRAVGDADRIKQRKRTIDDRKSAATAERQQRRRLGKAEVQSLYERYLNER